MDTSINDRVRSLVQEKGLVQKDLAQEIGIPPDALSRALNGQRGFGAAELARIADLLDADVYELITGEPDPHKVRVAARHTYDFDTKSYLHGTEERDTAHLEGIKLAYAQAYPDGEPPESRVLEDPEEVRLALGEEFVRHLADKLEEHLGIDVVRIPQLGTAYSMFIGRRAVIVIPASGNWYRENWDIAHELGHLATGSMGVGDTAEAAANNFAAQLLLPEHLLKAVDWQRLDVAGLGDLLWRWGVSTEALRRRLAALEVATSPEVAEWLQLSTPRLLRGKALPAAKWSAVVDREREAASRRFPRTLTLEHERAIAAGRVTKGTLAWMLGVDPDTLETAEPEVAQGSISDLAAMLGLHPA